MRGDDRCPACDATGLVEFHRVDSVPVNSCLLVADRSTALGFPTGQLRLARCPACGFITNTAFDPARSVYSPEYEETQAFSPRFQSFIEDLSRDWVGRFGLRGKRVVEIGCGKGEFLTEMVRAGAASGLGIDPGVHPERIAADVRDRIEVVPGFFPQDLPKLDADAVVCRHTLEHISPVAGFMTDVRTAIGDGDPVVLFELPGTQHVLDGAWFWDTYYEHCSYFTAGSLVRLMRRTGFDVLDVRDAYDGQYLLVEARPGPTPADGPALAGEDDLAAVAAGAEHFARSCQATVASWRERVGAVAERGGRSVIWGAGSKGVAFLAALGPAADAVAAAVDINPYKHGKFMAGAGHEIVPPQALAEIQPDLVVAMNSTYLAEIGAELATLNIETSLEGL